MLVNGINLRAKHLKVCGVSLVSTFNKQLGIKST